MPTERPSGVELDGLQPDQSSDHKNHKNHYDKRMIKITACDTNPELILAKPLWL